MVLSKRLLCWTPPADQCNAQTTSLPWHVVDDRVVLCHADATDKTLTTLANLVCDVTKTRGVTEIRMIDHSMQPKMKACGFPNSKFDQKNPKNLTHQICWITFISCIRWDRMAASFLWHTVTRWPQVSRWTASNPKTSRMTKWPFEPANLVLFGTAAWPSCQGQITVMWSGRPRGCEN